MFPARIAGFLLLLLPSMAFANGDADLCDLAAQSAARNASIPPDMLRALTRVETGRTTGGAFRPWPWTVNLEGKGYWFDTRSEAVDFVTNRYADGARSFDVGCFQINHRWHGQAFTSFNQMFAPQHNADYAAKFLKSLYEERGSWTWAAGAYHSRTETLAIKYRARFDRILAGLSEAPNEIDLPVVLASTEVTSNFRLSTWAPIQPVEMEAVTVINGSLAGGLLAHTGSPLLGKPNGALF